MCSHIMYSQCYEDRHNTSYTDQWVSCQESENPNLERGSGHWIMYDLGFVYNLGKVHIWNFNVPNQTNAGIKTAIIDYSIDGTSWEEWGSFTIEQANASGFYEGVEGPDLEGIKAKYVIITALDNYGGSCTGLSEIKIEVLEEVSSTKETPIAGLELSISPNPATTYSTVSFDSEQSMDGYYVVTDINGRTIKRMPININSGRSQVELDVSTYANGNYIFTVETEQGRLSQSFTKIENK